MDRASAFDTDRGSVVRIPVETQADSPPPPKASVVCDRTSLLFPLAGCCSCQPSIPLTGHKMEVLSKGRTCTLCEKESITSSVKARVKTQSGCTPAFTTSAGPLGRAVYRPGGGGGGVTRTQVGYPPASINL